MKQVLFAAAFSFCLVFCSYGAQAAPAEAEKYFNKSVEYYLAGETENAISLLTRALQKDPENTKYAALYDVMIEDRDKTRIVDFDYEMPVELKKYIRNYLRDYNRALNNRVQNITKALSEENISLRLKQEQLINEQLPAYEKKISVLSKWKDGLLILTGIICLFILMLIFVIINNSRRLKKSEETLKYITVRQDEQVNRLGIVEEVQKRLESRQTP